MLKHRLYGILFLLLRNISTIHWKLPIEAPSSSIRLALVEDGQRGHENRSWRSVVIAKCTCHYTCSPDLWRLDLGPATTWAKFADCRTRTSPCNVCLEGQNRGLEGGRKSERERKREDGSRLRLKQCEVKLVYCSVPVASLGCSCCCCCCCSFIDFFSYHMREREFRGNSLARRRNLTQISYPWI